MPSIALLLGLTLSVQTPEAPRPLPQPWDYAAAMKPVAARFRGTPGVVLHVGDSITYSSAYSAWPRGGEGRTPEQRALLAWMHAGAEADTDGWWLCRYDHPDGGRSHTACSGLRADELLAGGRRGLPALREMIDRYRPQAAVLMIGTNDASARRPTDAYVADVSRAVDLLLEAGCVCLLSTLPPHPTETERVRQYNEALRRLARDRKLPLIDFEREVLTRRPTDWNGTLLRRDDVHPSAGQGQVGPASAPTAENLRTSGFLLRGWLSVCKLAEVKETVLDAAAPPVVVAAVPRPQGTPVRVDVTRDTWFSDVDDEADANLGGAGRLKLKSFQEMSLVDIDPAGLRGRVIRGATLHLRHVADTPPLRRVTVSSFGAEWVEGTGTDYRPQPGSSTFRHRKHPDTPWTVPGSDLCAVMLGAGGTVWRNADAFPPDADGWQHVAVDPRVVAARVAGVSHGFLLFDDTGSEWTRRGEEFKRTTFPNRFVYSRESGLDGAPYFTVFLGPEDREPPVAPTGLRATADDLPAGEAWVTWQTPADAGPAGTVGFVVHADGREVPRYLIPMANTPGLPVRMHLHDLPFASGAEVKLSVRAVDGAGNVGPPVEAAIRVSDRQTPPLPGTDPEVSRDGGALPRLGETEVAVLDELDKVNPQTGALIPPQPAGYLAANHLWDARTREVRLFAARNEFVGFQVLLRGPLSGVGASLVFDNDGGTAPVAGFGRYQNVKAQQGPLPDPIVPLSWPAAREGNSVSLHGEVFVPHETRAGTHRGTLSLETQGKRLDLKVTLVVWDFTLPDILSFVPEMNCYGLPDNERTYYRLAHLHRTALNRVPYSHEGRVTQGCGPNVIGGRLDWAAWDARFGPLLDGSAFLDLPRRGIPVDIFYLPLFENWPAPMEGNYNGSYWADRAFPPRYEQTFAEVSRQFAAHFDARGWHDTRFQFFLNGKNNFKTRGWSHGTSPWQLDEPEGFQDFWALRYFGSLFHEGVRRAGGKARMVFRADISRPQWQRDALDGLLDYNVVNSALRRYPRLVFGRRAADGGWVIEYGNSNPVEGSNIQPVAWCVDAWTLGCDGVLPWQTLGEPDSWRWSDQQALFYPPPDGRGGPLPSIRLKAYRRGQQDVEYLTLLMQTTGLPRDVVAKQVREALKLRSEDVDVESNGPEDAGQVLYRKMTAQELWKLRVRVGRVLSAKRPPPQRRLVDRRPPPRDPSRLPNSYVSVGELPENTPAGVVKVVGKPAQPGAIRTVQGRPGVADVLIDPETATRRLGAVPRDNALRKGKDVSVFLVRFDLDRLSLQPNTPVEKATLHLFVWDPSSKGRTRLEVRPVTTAWSESAATWQQPQELKSWAGGETFAVGRDTGESVGQTIVEPDAANTDLADPPVEVTVDVTPLVRAWLSGKTPNHGVALVPVPDRTVDEGFFTRFQILASESDRPQFTPRLTVTVGK